MRTVVSNHEVPHLWAHQGQDSAKNGNGSLFFVGDTIYSYGKHFPIARLAGVIGRNGCETVFFTEREYSVTTQRHKTEVRRAIPSRMHTWTVPDVDTTPEHNMDTFRAQCECMLRDIGEAKNKVSKAKRYLKFESRVEYVNAFALEFGFEFVPLPEMADVNATLEVMREREEREERERQERWARQNEERKEQLRAELADEMETWKRGGTIGGRAYRFPDTLLRIEGEEVVTSKGARFPVSHAIKGLAFVERIRATGQPYQRNGHTFHLGHYAIDSIDVEGNVHAGCHYVTYAEISRIAPQLLAIVATVGGAQ